MICPKHPLNKMVPGTQHYSYRNQTHYVLRCRHCVDKARKSINKAREGHRASWRYLPISDDAPPMPTVLTGERA